jgi:hypothetical protein
MCLCPISLLWARSLHSDERSNRDPRFFLYRQQSGTRVYDVNVHGVDHYGLYPDWIEDLRIAAGSQIVNDMANDAEAYPRLWARVEAAAHR